MRRIDPVGANRVSTLFTLARNEADRIRPTQPIGFTYLASHALRALYEAPCGPECWSISCILGKVRLVVSFEQESLTGRSVVLVMNRVDWSAAHRELPRLTHESQKPSLIRLCFSLLKPGKMQVCGCLETASRNQSFQTFTVV